MRWILRILVLLVLLLGAGVVTVVLPLRRTR